MDNESFEAGMLVGGAIAGVFVGVSYFVLNRTIDNKEHNKNIESKVETQIIQDEAQLVGSTIPETIQYANGTTAYITIDGKPVKEYFAEKTKIIMD